MNTRNLFGLAIPLALLVLIGIVCLNASTPFRGEHWAMLYAWVKSNDWFSKLQRVVNIEYFGDHRFQPLNSAPMILGYLAFGTHFLPYYLFSLVLHFWIGLGTLRLLHLFRTGETLPFLQYLKLYPLPLAVFLVLFPSMEVILWTYFYYIQIATGLGVYAVGSFYEGKNALQRGGAYLLIALASLFYEPFLTFLVVFLLFNAVSVWKMFMKSSLRAKRSNHLIPIIGDCFALLAMTKRPLFLVTDFLFPISLLVSIGSQYFSGTLAKPISIPPDVSYINGILLQPGHDAIFGAPGAFNKILFTLYNQVLLFIHLCKSSFFFSYANKTNLFEMNPLPREIEALLPYLAASFLALMVWVGVRIKDLNRLRAFFLVLSLSGVATGAIFWGRPGAGHYGSVQFRYAFIILPLLFALGGDWLLRRKWKPLFLHLVLGYFFLVNATSSLFHAQRLSASFAPMTQFVQTLKNQGMNQDQVIIRIVQAIMDYEIQVPGHDVFLIYNGRGGLGNWYGKL